MSAKHLARISGVLVCAATLPALAFAESSGRDLATEATNPIGSANQLQFQNLFFPDNKNADGDANTFIIQPVVTFDLPDGGYFDGVVVRVTTPLISTPEVFDEETTAWGDTVALFAATHSKTGEVENEFFSWGPILAAGVPTSSDDRTGLDVWSTGPGIVGLKNDVYPGGNSLMYGLLAWHQWDFEDEDLSVTSAQPIFTYKFKSLFGQDGWYVRLPDDTWEYDWHADKFAVIPAGFGFGRAFSLGKQPVNTFLSAWYNAADLDDAVGPEWAIKASFSLVFPK